MFYQFIRFIVRIPAYKMRFGFNYPIFDTAMWRRMQ